MEIPSALKYETSAQYRGPKSGQQAKDDIVQACKRNDAIAHRAIDAAKDKAAWLGLLAKMLAANAVSYKEPGGLRPKVQEHFLADCPHEDIVYRFKRETGLIEQPGRNATSPLRKGRNSRTLLEFFAGKEKPTRKEIEARRADNRAARLARQPMRGSASGGGQKPGKKGDKKK